MKRHGRRTRILLNGVELTSAYNSADGPTQAGALDVTAFGEADKTYIPGTRDATLRLAGFWMPDTGGNDELHEALLDATTDPVITVVREPGVFEGKAFSGSGPQTSYQTSTPVGGVATASADFQLSDGKIPCRGLVEGTLIPSVVGGTTVAYNGGTATAQGAVGYLQALSVNGSPIVKIQHSANGTATWVDLITFSAQAAAGAQRVSVTGAVNPYLRTSVSGGTVVGWIGIHQPA